MLDYFLGQKKWLEEIKNLCYNLIVSILYEKESFTEEGILINKEERVIHWWWWFLNRIRLLYTHFFYKQRFFWPSLRVA